MNNINSEIRKLLAKKIGYPAQDLLKRTSSLKQKEFLLKSQHWNADRMYIYRLEKLKKLVDFAYNNVPYYSQLFKKLGIVPTDIKDLNDIKIIPILTKNTALNENVQLFANYSFKNLKVGKTGGTTGTPLTVKSNTNARSMVWGAYYRWYEWLGINVGDPIVTMWGATTVTSNSVINNLKESFINYFQNNLRMNSFNMNDETLPLFIKRISKKKPKIIKGYLSALLQLAKYIEDNNITCVTSGALSSTSEVLYPHFRNYLEKIFNSKIYDQYGCGECQSVAYECTAQEGLHVTEEHVIIEILDDNQNDIINKDGRIILTDLDNYAMPFMRYENGDSGSFLAKKCSCGVPHKLIGNIAGRTADTIILNDGSKVHGVFFTDIVFEINSEESRKILRFQAYQERIGEVEFRIEANNKLESNFLKEINNILKVYFNKVDVVIMDKIPNEQSGKFKYVKSIIN